MYNKRIMYSSQILWNNFKNNSLYFCKLTVNRCKVTYKGASSKCALVSTLYRELLSRPEWDLFPSLQAGGRRRHWKLSLPEVSTPLTWPRSVTENNFRVGQESLPQFLDKLKQVFLTNMQSKFWISYS